jgi:hypothetical protein
MRAPPPLLLTGLAFLAQAASAAEPTLSCVDALEQIETLKTWVPVYRQLPGEERHYLPDADRPAELARIQKIAASACSTDPRQKAAQRSQAERLHVARSPECAIERDKLSAMEQPDSLEAKDSVREQRKRVAAQCPAVPMANLWLLQMVWAKPQP